LQQDVAKKGRFAVLQSSKKGAFAPSTTHVVLQRSCLWARLRLLHSIAVDITE
jgi:hypothetical protein